MEQDERTKERVKEALFSSMDNADLGIITDVRKGHVTLSGIVDTLSEKHFAAEVIRKIPEVKSVENALTISMDRKTDDDDIAQVITDRLVQEPRLKDSRLSAAVNKGVVYLKGSVKTLAEKELAETLAGTVMGVKEIVNQVRIGEKLEGPHDDATLVNAVEVMFSASEELAADDIKTDCRRGVIYLSGKVRSPHESDMAEYLAKTVPGVRRVVNELVVQH